ncbi:MAG: hypothetical protein QXX56_05790, partial [Candidatus Bathyarchaeia archaeon]
IIQVITMGEIILRVQADFPDQTIKIIGVDYGEVEERLRKLKEILGREPTRISGMLLRRLWMRCGLRKGPLRKYSHSSSS